MTRILKDNHVKAMVSALREAKLTVEETEETIIASHSKHGEVFRALKKDNFWITRFPSDLFNEG
jgi:hypothetical protein